jgi:biopolymer transport protein ExbB/TolQ
MPIWMYIVEWMARGILVFLIGLSIYSLSIILEKKKMFALLTPSLWMKHEGIKKLLESADSYQNEKIDLYFSIQLSKLKKEWEKGLGILGTLGSSTPFIGLLGTILGIIVAFGELSQGKADTNAIMFALAEALILTAVGLFVAIPAVVAFNNYNRKIKVLMNDLEALKNEMKLRK